MILSDRSLSRMYPDSPFIQPAYSRSASAFRIK